MLAQWINVGQQQCNDNIQSGASMICDGVLRTDATAVDHFKPCSHCIVNQSIN